MHTAFKAQQPGRGRQRPAGRPSTTPSLPAQQPGALKRGPRAAPMARAATSIFELAAQLQSGRDGEDAAALRRLFRITSSSAAAVVGPELASKYRVAQDNRQVRGTQAGTAASQWVCCPMGRPHSLKRRRRLWRLPPPPLPLPPAASAGFLASEELAWAGNHWTASCMAPSWQLSLPWLLPPLVLLLVARVVAGGGGACRLALTMAGWHTDCGVRHQPLDSRTGLVQPVAHAEAADFYQHQPRRGHRPNKRRCGNWINICNHFSSTTSKPFRPNAISYQRTPYVFAP